FAATTKSGPDANFEIILSNLSAGSYNFSVYAVDNLGNQSVAQSFPVSLTASAAAVISGIFIAPSIAVDKQEVKQGDNIAIFGRSAPTSEVVISINSAKEIFAKAPTDGAGAYLYNLDTIDLEMGDHTAKSKASKSGAISPFGSTVGFKVGTQNILATNKPKPKPLICPPKGDLNNDCKVNLVDFSIAAYWYKRSLAGAIIQTEKAKLNGDGKINLVDFSLIAYYWTG
ncbi:MAG: dockerin type I domain-containing protein, partial [Candidatus Paceibacterota bacterium]